METGKIILAEGRQRLIRARHGYLLYNSNDTVIGRLIETYGEYFEAEVNVFQRFVRPGAIALDIGANIGAHTLAFARMVGPGGFAYAFEPQRLVFQTLCANMALNSLDNVHCVNAALGETAGCLNITDPDPDVPNNFGGARVEWLTGESRLSPVPQLVLDDFLDIDRLSFIKIDVEGMESQVLRGARKIIGQFRPVIYVENDVVEKSPELLSLLGELGYQCYWHLPVYVSDDNYFRSPEKIFPVHFVDDGGPQLGGIGFAVNLLCVHASAGLPITGLRPATDPAEHPYRRDCVHHFTGRNGSGIALAKA